MTTQETAIQPNDLGIKYEKTSDLAGDIEQIINSAQQFA